MCWNKETSLISFIVGTIINISVMIYFITKSEPFMYGLCIIWQWVLMMQLSEYFIWLDQENGKMNKYASKAALVFNITQPIVIFLVCICISKVSIKIKVISCIIILLYIIFMLIKFNEVDEYKNLNPSKNCSHLNLKWWNDIKYSSIVYCITLVLIILLLYRPFNMALFKVFFIIIMLFISIIFYGCGGPSMWCWFVVPFPIFATLFYIYLKRKNKIELKV